MALMGPEGMTEVGETILANSNYARKLIGQIDGVKVPFGATFKEFVVDFNGTGKTVAEINKALEAKKIFGGFDLSKDFPELGTKCALLRNRNTYTGRYRQSGAGIKGGLLG